MAEHEAVRSFLVVCTGNICRSPMAEALLTRELRARGSRVRVQSAGVRAVGGPADDFARQVMASRGLDITAHKSTGVTAQDITSATLVLAMERAHVAEIAGSIPGAFVKTFGFTEVVALGRQHGRRTAAEPIETWLTTLDRDRRPTDVLRAGAAFDIADPHGRSLREYERCADRLARLTKTLVDLVEPPNDRRPPNRSPGHRG